LKYPCPYKGTEKGNKHCNRDADTVRGWKVHMTRQHSEYTQEQLQQVLGASGGNTEEGRSQFLAELEREGDAPGALGDAVASPTKDNPTPTDPAPEKTVALKTDATGKKLSAKFNKFKTRLADQFPKAIDAALKDKGSEWQMDESDRGILTESIESCFEVLDIEFKVAPINMQLSNPLWVLLLPVLALLLVFGVKGIKNMPKLNLGGGDAEPETAKE